jgi:hypothetical protein
LREATATRAPFLASASPMALPMPVPPPVTKAILPMKLIFLASDQVEVFLSAFSGKGKKWIEAGARRQATEYGEEIFYPPTQKTPGVSPGMNASDGPSVARRAKEGECFGGFRRRN